MEKRGAGGDGGEGGEGAVREATIRMAFMDVRMLSAKLPVGNLMYAIFEPPRTCTYGTGLTTGEQEMMYKGVCMCVRGGRGGEGRKEGEGYFVIFDFLPIFFFVNRFVFVFCFAMP